MKYKGRGEGQSFFGGDLATYSWNESACLEKVDRPILFTCLQRDPRITRKTLIIMQIYSCFLSPDFKLVTDPPLLFCFLPPWFFLYLPLFVRGNGIIISVKNVGKRWMDRSCLRMGERN